MCCWCYSGLKWHGTNGGSGSSGNSWLDGSCRSYGKRMIILASS